MNSVRLYYIKHGGENDLQQIDALLLEQWLFALSPAKRAAIQRLLYDKDQITSLLGLQLLSLCTMDDMVENFKLSDVQYPETGKPFWKQGDAFYDFNISHSGDFILMAASTSSKVGVDVEKIKPLKRLNFKMVMSDDELLRIKSTPALFFDLWSKKEAVVKAANTTGIARMRDVQLQKKTALLDEVTWYLETMKLHDDYAINLAVSKPVDKLIVKQIQLSQISEQAVLL